MSEYQGRRAPKETELEGSEWTAAMTNSDHTSYNSPKLCLEVRRMETLWNSWMSVRSRAIHSRNPETKSDARKIDQNPQRALRQIHEQLRRGTFRFELQRGVLKKRKGKDPRPLVVSPVANRIVQRAILETLQNQKAKVRSALGEIPSYLNTPTSVGGLPKRGAQDAVRLIRGAIQNGAEYFIRSDIKDFFTGIPTAKLVAWIGEQTGDAEFAKLIEMGLKVELANANDPMVQEWFALFPDGETGVPQGSSLAAYFANVTLARFDAELNANNIVTIRYIDDFVILGQSEADVQTAWKTAEMILGELNLQVHQPVVGGSKASLGKVSSGFDFLSYRFDHANVGVSRTAKAKFLESVKQTLREGKNEIRTSLRAQRRAEQRFIQTLNSLDRRIRGWGDSFQDVTLRVQFDQIDKQISDEIREFMGWYRRISANLDDSNKRRALGVALLSDTPKRGESGSQ
tara:strand:+ start:288 stop:1661 length:1374 start_codon:yes stop_codon:yes gene_type:complete